MLDSLVRVSRRVVQCQKKRPWYSRRPKAQRDSGFYPTAPSEPLLPPTSTRALPATRYTVQPQPPRFTRSTAQQRSFPLQQFHVLFNPLFKVLFIFPSRYLFAIGLLPIFSLGWNLPPTLSCIPKQLDSSTTGTRRKQHASRRDCHPLWCPFPGNLNAHPPRGQQSLNYNSHSLTL